MTHNQQDITEHHEGDALEIHVAVVDSDGEPMGLVDSEIEWLLFDDEADPDADALLTKSTNAVGEITITDPDAGEFTVKLDSGDTEGMVGNLHHRARVTDVDGDRATIFTGKFEVIE